MIRKDADKFTAIGSRARVGILALGLVVSALLPAQAAGSGTWTTTGSLSSARAGHSATLLPNGQVLVAGGEASSGFLTNADLYNPATGKWTATRSMAAPRSGHMATLLPSGEVLVAGGMVNVSQGGVITATAAAELYNPSTGQWTATGSMTTARYSSGVALLHNGQVLVAGGYNPANGRLASAELYDPSTGAWKTTGSMNDARSTQATLLLNGQVLMAAGDAGGRTAELYSSGQWTLTSGMVFTHPATHAALLPNGDVLAYGGHLASYVAEFYNPTTNTWLRTHNIAVNPPFGPLTLLGTGQVLLAGGESGYGTDALCKLYDSPSNAWLSTGSMNQARTAHTATRLANGQVLVVGGEFKNSNGSFTLLASAELYTP